MKNALAPRIVQIEDNRQTPYRFEVYGIDEAPSGRNVVYMFCIAWLVGYSPLYIGRAEDLSKRLANHERKDQAKARGASALLVHRPGLLDYVQYKEAEIRLIQSFNPSLNVQHNALGGLFLSTS
ncbi:GIY-YIG nuclease family protein [Rhodovulum strictum]|uniref:GIY-YIG domain-containing protein n=1 Tax=Rhodovulum strictum TaxID=58314 RepID=A0A844B3J8_9RHOB|nr:hypothetical protein [Rhodovulum strictum]MRH20310.1 hypothetical protein [Rhodovulum strictum]